MRKKFCPTRPCLPASSRGDDASALDMYNQSVMVAPCDRDTGVGEDLAIAVANRSAVLYRQQKFL